MHLVNGLLVRYTSVSKGPPKRELLVAHHNNMKVSAMLNLKGTVVCPTPESPEISVVEQEVTSGDNIGVERGRNVRPRNLLHRNYGPFIIFVLF